MKNSRHIWHLVWIIVVGIVIAFFYGCDYGRMREDAAIDIYEVPMPDIPSESVPMSGGLNALLTADIEQLSNPLPDNEKIVQRGAVSYDYYCSHCHGPEGRGYGTVGQSFAPLPTDLGSQYVQEQSDGLVFYRISMGFLRHPPLYYTVSADDRWAIVRYIRQIER